MAAGRLQGPLARKRVRGIAGGTSNSTSSSSTLGPAALEQMWLRRPVDLQGTWIEYGRGAGSAPPKKENAGTQRKVVTQLGPSFSVEVDGGRGNNQSHGNGNSGVDSGYACSAGDIRLLVDDGLAGAAAAAAREAGVGMADPNVGKLELAAQLVIIEGQTLLLWSDGGLWEKVADTPASTSTSSVAHAQAQAKETATEESSDLANMSAAARVRYYYRLMNKGGAFSGYGTGNLATHRFMTNSAHNIANVDGGSVAFGSSSDGQQAQQNPFGGRGSVRFAVDLRTPNVNDNNARASGYEGDEEAAVSPESARVAVLVRRVLMGDPHLLSAGVRVGGGRNGSGSAGFGVLDFSYESACELLRGLATQSAHVENFELSLFSIHVLNVDAPGNGYGSENQRAENDDGDDLDALRLALSHAVATNRSLKYLALDQRLLTAAFWRGIGVNTSIRVLRVINGDDRNYSRTYDETALTNLRYNSTLLAVEGLVVDDLVRDFCF